MPRILPYRRAIVALSGGIGLLCLCAPGRAAQGLDHLRITLFALDRGEATLIETPGEHALLVGAGTREEGPRIVSWLKGHGVKRLEGVFVQTWKETHIGGMPAVLKAFSAGQVLTNPSKVDTPASKTLDQVASVLQQKDRLVYGAAIPGDTHNLNFDPFCQVTMVAPSGAMQRRFRQDPNNSMVLEFRQEKTAFLTLGDTQQKHQEAILKEQERAPWGQVLRIGQNGAPGSLLPRMLQALKTRVAVIPVARKAGARPDPAVLAALRKAGVRVYRTDTQGTITVHASDRILDVRTGGPRL